MYCPYCGGPVLCILRAIECTDCGRVFDDREPPSEPEPQEEPEECEYGR
jgi:transcription initiation factor TFIIIB Brf1 subunit/transcription initiation factor TFIIB